MNLFVRRLLLFLGISVVLANCAKWNVSPYDLIPQAITRALTAKPATTSVTLDCEVGPLGPNVIQEFGVVYSASKSTPTVSDSKVVANGTSGTAKVTLNGLLPNTTYNYSTYVTNTKGQTGYGSVQTFTTDAVVAEIQTLDVVGTATASSAVVECVVNNAGSISLKEYGIYYSTTQTPNQGTKVVATGTGGKVPVTLSGLQPNTIYYYQAYATLTSGATPTSYGVVKSFTTVTLTALVETLDAVGTAGANAVDVQLQVTNAGSVSVKEYGIIYSKTNQNPIQGTKVIATGTGGKTTVSLTGLDPNSTYYYQAYAVLNSGGSTAYGAVKTVATGGIVIVTLDGRPSQLDDKSVTINFSVDQPASIIEYGVVLTSDINQTSQLLAGTAAPIKQPKTEALPGTGPVSFQAMGLTPNTIYYAAAYVKDGGGRTTISKVYATFKTKGIAQGNWRQLTELPANRAYVYNPMFTINGKVYVGTTTTGSSDYFFNQLYEYDPLTNLWTRKKDFPGTGRAEPSVAVLNNKGYIFFGYNKPTKTYLSDAWEYDPATDNWRQLTNPPVTASGGSGAFNQQQGGITGVFNNRIYSLFGRGPSTNPTLLNVFNSEYVLNTAGAGTWDINFPFNAIGLTNDVIYSAARSGAFSFQYGSFIYFGGGLAASNYTAFGSNLPYSTYFNSRQIWTRDLQGGGLKSVALLPSSFNDCSRGSDSGGLMENCAFLIGTKAYIIDCDHKTWVMDVTTNATPAYVPSLDNPALQSVGIGIGVGNKAYWGLRNSDWWEFTP